MVGFGRTQAFPQVHSFLRLFAGAAKGRQLV